MPLIMSRLVAMLTKDACRTKFHYFSQALWDQKVIHRSFSHTLLKVMGAKTIQSKMEKFLIVL